MSNEYSYKTLKQNLIDGLSKKEFILSKFYTVIAFAAISTVFVFIVSLVLGLVYSDYNEFAIIVSDLEYILAFFIKLVGFFSFGLFLGILVKRSAFAIGAMVAAFVSGAIDKFMQFLPLEAMTNLIKEPFSRLGAVRSAANTMGETFTKSYSVDFTNILIVSCWTFIFIFLSYKLLLKRDL